MPIKRNSVNRNLMALTRRYQRKFPERIGGQPKIGRISLKARAEYIKSASKLFVKDPVVVDLAFDIIHTPEWGIERIKKHAIEKTGSPQLAVALLKSYGKSIDASRTREGGFFDNADIARSGKIMNLSKKDQDTFESETIHMLEPIWILQSKINMAIRELEKK